MENFDEMNKNLALLKDRIIDAIDSSDLENINQIFSGIKGPTICVGSGGSSVAAEFAAKVINLKNDCAAETRFPRELNYMNLKGYKNIFMISYSGKNIGVDTAFDNSLKHYMLTANSKLKHGVNTFNYKTTLPKEDSFISLAATLIPMSIMLACYFDGDKHKTKNIIEEMFVKEAANRKAPKLKGTFEVVGGRETQTALKFVESTLIEAGIANVIMHEKYDMCHGRATLAKNNGDRALLYMFDRANELDNMWLHLSKDMMYDKSDMNVLVSNYNDIILNDFYLTLKGMHFCAELAKQKGIDLSSLKNQEGKRMHITDPLTVRYNKSLTKMEPVGKGYDDGV